MSFDLNALYELMLKSRLYEESIAQLWHDGLISGEMHLGTGEEAIYAGVVSQLSEGDAMALDHRGTSALLVRGVDPVALIREFLGDPEGVCGGMGGHMHLFSKELLAVSSGIVGSSGPAAAGFALAGKRLRPGSAAVAFFGEGAMNQGMLLESMNLASVWKLPVLFVCKDDAWSITTESSSMTGGDVDSRASALGVKSTSVDGLDVDAVYHAAADALAEIREGTGPRFLRATCVHLEGHFLGYQLKRIAQKPMREMGTVAGSLTRSFLQSGGANLKNRLQGLRTVTSGVITSIKDSRRVIASDPLPFTRSRLELPETELDRLENTIQSNVERVFHDALAGRAI